MPLEMLVSWDPASKVTDLILSKHGKTSILDSAFTEAGKIVLPSLSTVTTLPSNVQIELSDEVGAVLLAVLELKYML
jgi:hypothetical protein